MSLIGEFERPGVVDEMASLRHTYHDLVARLPSIPLLNKRLKAPPDGGYGYVAVFACWLSLFVSTSQQQPLAGAGGGALPYRTTSVPP